MNEVDQLLGTTCRLYITKQTANGVYLSPPDNSGIQILLPKNQVSKTAEKGDILEVFIYKDSEDRPIATTSIPYISLGQVARLNVTDVTSIGAFLDWGLAKDLLLPFKEQTERVHNGQSVLVALYLDKSSRLCGTMHVYDYLSSDSDYDVDDHVTGFVYEIIDAFGTFVAIDDKFSAMLPPNEMVRPFHVGDKIEARVKDIREDGKLTLSVKEKVPLQMGIDAEQIWERLINEGGFLPFHDKTAPEIIKREFGMSKNAFKRAIGRLLKEKKILITEEGIKENHS